MRASTMTTYRCSRLTAAGTRCKKKTTNANKDCGVHPLNDPPEPTAEEYKKYAEEMIELMNTRLDKSRQSYHLTLEEMIVFLEQIDGDLASIPVLTDTGQTLGMPHSYRGYYEDLAFDPTDAGPSCVAGVLSQCRMALGSEQTGYKGGEFMMTETTPLWVSPYGEASQCAIIDAMYNGKEVIVTTKQLRDDY